MSILFCIKEEKYQVQVFELNTSSSAMNEAAIHSLPNAILVDCSYALVHY